jgi:hypothetical protein
MMKRRILFAVFAVLLLGSPQTFAQSNAPLRVRGRIAHVAGNELTVAVADGKPLHIILAPDTTVTAIVPARLTDIKPGRFVGTAARPDGDKWRALEVHIFPAGLRSGEGHRPWAPEAGATMTNADVTAAVRHAGQGELTLATGGQSFTIEVPPGTPIIAMKPASRQQLVKGAFVYLAQVTDENGTLTARGVAVGKDGRWPPK